MFRLSFHNHFEFILSATCRGYGYRSRSDDMIKVAAQWISQVMVEDALRSYSS